MAVRLLDSHCEAQIDTYPLLMENSGSQNEHEHVINITKGDVASTSTSHDNDHSDTDELHYEDRPSTSTRHPISQPPPLSPVESNPRNTSFRRRNDSNNSRPRRSPLNSGVWISIELLVNVSQIVAAIIVLSLSRHEKPHAPLFAWVIGYTAGCIATLPHLCWRYIHRNGQGSDQETTHSRQTSFQGNLPETARHNQAMEGGNHNRTSLASWLGQNLAILGPRLNALVDHFKMALDCFFAVWFVVGNVWIFGGHSSPADSPNLYRLCIAFLTFSCIGYAMPFILCATICCCLPCIISILGFREDLGNSRGATTESINALPTYKFKSKRRQNREDSEINSEGPAEGGIFAPGTDKERIVSAEDAVCCICLARYLDNEELRELPCAHFFHTECVDKWLAINALCPLCKSDVGNATASSAFFASTGRRATNNWRSGNSGENGRV